MRRNSQIVTTLQEQETEEKQKKEFLKQQLYFSKTNEFVEKQAREKLGMMKEGEYIVLKPAPTKMPRLQPLDTVPNWKKWWNLFF